jgi:hypothetical protein
VHLELRVWLKRAVQRPLALDQLVRGIKHGFDEHGVAFPFPQRTVSYLADLPKPSPAPEFLAGEAARKPTVLVCTRGPEGARAMSDAIVTFVERLGARLVVLHVRPAHMAVSDHDAQVGINMYLARANEAKLPAKGRAEIGDLSDVVAAVAREEGAKLIIFGRSRRTGFSGRWLHREIAELEATDLAPILELDTDRVADDGFVARWRAELHPAPEDPPQEDQRPREPEAEAPEEPAQETKPSAQPPEDPKGAQKPGPAPGEAHPDGDAHAHGEPQPLGGPDDQRAPEDVGPAAKSGRGHDGDGRDGDGDGHDGDGDHDGDREGDGRGPSRDVDEKKRKRRGDPRADAGSDKR